MIVWCGCVEVDLCFWLGVVLGVCVVVQEYGDEIVGVCFVVGVGQMYCCFVQWMQYVVEGVKIVGFGILDIFVY